MKKIFCLLAVLLFIFSFAGCKTVEYQASKQSVIINMNGADFIYGDIDSGEVTVKSNDYKSEIEAIERAKLYALNNILRNNEEYDVVLFPKYEIITKGKKITVIARGRLAKVKR